ncbi:MAG: methylated-DNA--[protein]-cysteine S-methyltransferase, partial [Alphaproteobacteria bacterium]
MPQLSLLTPYGEMTLSEEDGALVALDWGRGRDRQETPLLRRAARQLHAYFDGERTMFDLPLAPHGTPFQRRVWQTLRAVPYGQTLTYGALAARLSSHARAVGQAVGKNPLPIIVPC